MNLTYTIGTLSSLTGLSQHTIRAWERRYRALSPDRSESNRRLYQDEDVERLSMLKRIVESGHSIGQVAQLSTDQLRALENRGRIQLPVEQLSQGEGGLQFLGDCKVALLKLDSNGLEHALARGSAALGVIQLVDQVIVPLLTEVEHGWSDGTIGIHQEHMLSSVLQAFLGQVRNSLQSVPSASRLLVTTPKNQMHELGALMAATCAAANSWNVTYLGPNLPAEQIAAAALQTSAQAIALSIVFPHDDPSLPDELRLLRKTVGPNTPILVGGRAATEYAEVLEEIQATLATDFHPLAHLVRNASESRRRGMERSGIGRRGGRG